MFGINDPSALLRPWRNLTQFSEELYAMFSRGAAPGVGNASPSAGSGRGQEQAAIPSRDGRDGRAASSVRKSRLADSYARLKMPETPGSDLHVTAVRSARAAHPPGAPRTVPALAAADINPFVPPSPEKIKTYQNGGVTVEQRTAQQASDEHATTRRVSDQTDHSFSLSASGLDYAPKAKDATRNSPTAAVDSSQEQRRSQGEPRKSGSRDSGNPTEEKSPYEPRKSTEWPVFEPKPVLDIGDFARPSAGGGGGATVFMGKVSSGSGDTYQVTLYSGGPDAPADSPDVKVKIPMIDLADQIPADTWIGPIFQFPATAGVFGDSGEEFSYYCQPPVWMS